MEPHKEGHAMIRRCPSVAHGQFRQCHKPDGHPGRHLHILRTTWSEGRPDLGTYQIDEREWDDPFDRLAGLFHEDAL
jgi:hypothetical protein